MAYVLVVEDEPLVRMATVDLAADAGFLTLEASSADEALSILKRGVSVSMVVTDVDMPGTMNGADLAFALRSSFPSVEVVVVSGVSTRPPLPDGVPYLTKPLREDMLLSLLENLRRGEIQNLQSSQ